MDTLKTRSWIPRIVLSVLILSLAVGLSVAGRNVRASVDPSFDPTFDVQLNAAGIVVTWLSAADEVGVVEYATSSAALTANPSTATDDRLAVGTPLNQKTHKVSITGIAGGSTVFFNLVSGGVTDVNGPYQVTMPSVALSAAPVGITGSITFEDTTSGVECLVYIQVEQLFFGIFLVASLPINTITDGGDYAADIKNIRSEQDFNTSLAFDASSADATITVTARCDPDTNGTISRTTLAADKLTVAGSVSEYQNMDVVVTAPLPAPTFSIADVTVDEGASNATLTISLSPAATTTSTVDVATADGTATAGLDYTAVSTTATITAGATTTTVQVPINDDTLDELNETFTATLSNASAGTEISANPGTATVTITDNDAPPSIAAPADFAVTEGDTGTTAANVNVTLSTASGLPVSVDFATADGTATTADADYVANSSTLTIAAGSTSGTITVLVNGDTVIESDETFTVTLSNATTTSGTAPAITDAATTVTITNDDFLQPTVSIADATVAEDVGNATLTVSLSNTFNSAVTVVVDTSDGTATAPADYTAVVATTLTIAIGDTTATVQVPINDDTLDELNETFTATLSNATNGVISGTAGSATVTITDNDSTPSLSVPLTASVLEGDSGTATATITVTLSAVSGLPVSVDFATSDGTATAPTDYTAVATTTLTIAAGSTSGTIQVTVIGDTVIEDDETFTVTLSNATTASGTPTITQATTVVTITTDDFEAPTFSIADVTVNEVLGTVSLIITLTPAATTTTTVDVATSDGTATAPADYAAVSTTVTFNAGVATSVQQVTIVDDAIDELDETFTVSLSNPTGGAIVSTAGGSATVTIEDNDAPPTVGMDAATASVTEGDAGATTTVTLQVSLSTVSGLAVTVDFATADGTATTADGDYVTNSGTLTIAAGSTSATISVVVNGDEVIELDETFTVTLSNAATPSTTAALAITLPTTTVTILNDDVVPPVLSIGNVTVAETAGTATLTVSMDKISGTTVTVDVATSDGTATAGLDYTAVATTPLTIAPGSTSVSTIVTILDDAIEEPAETFTVTLSNPSQATISATAGSATVTINDDEPAVKVVTVTSEGEALAGDQYFLVVAGSDSPALGLQTIQTVTQTSPGTVSLMSIAAMPDILTKMHGLGEVRSKTATHVWLANVSTTQAQATVTFQVDLVYAVGGTKTLTATLDVLGARTNRNFFLEPGVNFTGLALVPDDTSIANLLDQSVTNANPAFETLLGGSVDLEDVIQTIFAFQFTTSGGFISFTTPDPVSGVAPASGGLTNLDPFQGMLIKTRETVAPASPGVNVFEQVTVAGVTRSVPIKMTINGPFLDVTTSNPLQPVTKTLRVGFNLVAPHVSDDTAFDTAFGGSGSIPLDQLYSSAISFERDVIASVNTSTTPPTFEAEVVEGFVTESASIPGFVGPGTIRPELAYWVRVAVTSPQATPTLTATGPNE